MKNTSSKRSAAAALIGHMLERYDLSIYGYFATVLAFKFFPEDASNAIALSMAVFIISYFMRPFGGIVFGFIGDKLGRKSSFIYSVIFTLLSSLIIAVLPTYGQIGIFACIILLFSRMLQSLCAGGEFGGVGVFIGEHVDKNRPGFYASMVCATGLLGALLSTAIGTISTLSFMPSWGWRIPFIVGVFLTGFAVYLRTRMLETPVFLEIQKNQTLSNNPFKDVIFKYKTNILRALFIGGCGHALLYLPIFYINIIYKAELHCSSSFILGMNTLVLSFWVLLSPVAGVLADRIGVIRQMSSVLLIAIIAVLPLFYLFHSSWSISNLVAFQIIMSVIGVFYVAPISGVFTDLFPSNVRHTGVAFGVSLGQALLGSTIPLFSQQLVAMTGNRMAPGLYLIGIMVITLFVLNNQIKLVSNTKQALAA